MPTTDPQDEIFPLVNEHGEVVGRTTRRQAHSDRTIIHPSVGIFVFNPRGEMLIQKRSATKDFEPGCWTLSVGGHVQHGDTPVIAAVREAKEEVGLDILPEKLQALGEVLTRNVRETEYWYGFRYDMPTEVSLTAHPDEVAELQFVPLKELRGMIDDPAIQWSEDAKRLIKDFILVG